MRSFLLGLALILAPITATAGAVSTLLPIPARVQWDNNNGYCGECSIQAFALYFGTYASQYQIRQIIDPTQKQDLWIGDHEETVLNALRMTYETWNSAQSTPQYQKHLGWIKNHLHARHPVIITLFVAGDEDKDYDHIVPAVGFTSASDWTTYHAADTLTFFDNYELDAYVRPFSTLYDTRDMAANGADYEYCIPRDVNFATAMTGIRDDDRVTLPVRLGVNRSDEPNVLQGQSAVTLTGTLTIESLVKGRRYTLLRYDKYQNVPTRNFLASNATSRQTFTATGATRTLTDHFSSNSIVIYRCVPAASSARGWIHYE